MVTAIKGINAEGNIIPLFLIFTGKAILEEWFKYLTELEWKITITNLGFLNDEIMFE